MIFGRLSLLELGGRPMWRQYGAYKRYATGKVWKPLIHSMRAHCESLCAPVSHSKATIWARPVKLS